MNELVLPLQKKLDTPLVLGMGFFDCVHIGHRRLIDRITSLAENLGAKRAITTFSNNPYKVFNPDSKLIYTYDERMSLFCQTKLDYCVPFKFDIFFKAMPAEEFLSMIVDSLNIKGIVCGYDYMFGAGGKGNTDFLESFCKQRGIVLEVQEPVVFEGERVSSTLVKQCLIAGHIQKANTLLSSTYFISGKVTHGQGVGKTIGFPTANIKISKDKMLPKHGVYASTAYVDGKSVPAITNIGTKPTVKDSKVSVETHIIGESLQLYGSQVVIRLNKYLRQIKKFDSIEQLKQQIASDIKEL